MERSLEKVGWDGCWVGEGVSGGRGGGALISLFCRCMFLISPSCIGNNVFLIFAYPRHLLFFKFRCIMKTCLYSFAPLKPHFYIVKLGFTGVYIIFLIYAQKHCGYSLEPPRHNLYFEQKYGKYQNFYLKTFSFWW